MNVIITKIYGVTEDGGRNCRIYMIPEGIFTDVVYTAPVVQELVNMKCYRPLRSDEERLIVESGKIFKSVAALEYGLHELKIEKARREAFRTPARTRNNPFLLSAAVYVAEEHANEVYPDGVMDIIIRYRKDM